MAKAKREQPDRPKNSLNEVRSGKDKPPLRRGPDMRTAGMLALSCASGAAVIPGLRLALSAAFAALFRAWGVNAANVGRAPAWARWIFGGCGGVIALAASLALIGLSALLRRLWLGEGRSPMIGRPDWRAWLALAAGLVMTVMPAAVYLILDSLRLDGGPRLSVMAPLWLIGTLIILAGEEIFTKRVIHDGVASRWGRAWAAAFAALAFFAMNGGWAGGLIGAVNTLLLGALTALVYGGYGLWAAVALRWGWSIGTGLIFGRTSAAILRFYGVSEMALTGGDGGVMFGWGMTILLAGAILYLKGGALKGFLHGIRKDG